MFCNNCGAENSDDGKFCSKCGNQLERKGSRISTENKRNIDKKNKITIGLILSWVFGVFFFLGGLAFISDLELLAGIPLMLASFLLIPLISEWMENKFNYNISRGLRITLVIVLFCIYAFNLPDEYVSQENNLENPIVPQESLSTQPIQTSTPTPTITPTPIVSTISFSEFDRIFGDKSSLTDLQKKEEFKNYKDKTVSWEGYLSDVDEGWTGDYCVLIKTKSSSQPYADFKSCNPTESFKNKLLTYQIGDRVILTGTIQNYLDIYPSYYVEGTDINKL